MHWIRLLRYLYNLLSSSYCLKGISFYRIYIEEDIFFCRIRFCKVKFHEFLQIGTIRKNKIHDLFWNWIAKANGLRKNFAHGNSKKNSLVCVCFFNCIFLSCHVRVSEWIHNPKFKWLQLDFNPQPLSS